MISCATDDNSQQTNLLPQIEANISSGTWKITNFNDSGNDETNHLTNYSFVFATNGSLTAGNGTNNYAGTWNISDHNSEDDSQIELDFNINFYLLKDFDDLSEDWNIQTQSIVKIELIHTSGGNGGTNYLTFEKN
jgi:hypothetical protein